MFGPRKVCACADAMGVTQVRGWLISAPIVILLVPLECLTRVIVKERSRADDAEPRPVRKLGRLKSCARDTSVVVCLSGPMLARIV